MSSRAFKCVWRSVDSSLHSSPLRMTKATHRATNIMQKRMHSFAPMSNGSNVAGGQSRLKGIVFDMDGTLCLPQNYMFAEMRQAVNIPKGSDILDYIHALPEKGQQEAFGKIQDIERTAMSKQVPQAGLVSLMEFLDQHEIRKGICTRNFDAPVNHLLSNHLPRHINPFSPIITRDFRPPKPSPAGILHIAHAWGITDTADVPTSPPEERQLPMIMVGDSIDDMIAGHDAGAMTVLLRSEGKEELEKDPRTHLVISRLDELIALLKNGLNAAR
ncbi:hypothetical protein D0869_06460 [Hortaea werneckii]|uniref:HAD-like protein n=1 Tax=Hortaea werneckii TaxID=91943 RepID=A0A3M6WTW9_HORWE|nr:hypothetical protein D0869_06460 [Hortaea werneckii]RMY04785.1 hypothetical protein D0868_06770 [Hortaea werneckii]